jgi:uncharacterized integral membrane protein
MLNGTMYLIVLLVVFGLLGVFAVQNGGTQDFTLLGYTWNLPIWVPTAIGTAIVSVLLLLQMSHAGLGARFREFGHGRSLNEHRGVIEELRDQNARLREQLAELRGAASASQPSGRSWTAGLRDLPNRVRAAARPPERSA